MSIQFTTFKAFQVEAAAFSKSRNVQPLLDFQKDMPAVDVYGVEYQGAKVCQPI